MREQLVLIIDRSPSANFGAKDSRICDLYDELNERLVDLDLRVWALEENPNGLIPVDRLLAGYDRAAFPSHVRAIWLLGMAAGGALASFGVKPRSLLIVDSTCFLTPERRKYDSLLSDFDDIAGDAQSYSHARERDRRILEAADIVTVCSALEAKSVSSLAPRHSKIMTVNAALHYSAASFAPYRKGVAVFASPGSGFGSPDDFGVRWFGTRVVPRVRRELEGFEAVLVADVPVPKSYAPNMEVVSPKEFHDRIATVGLAVRNDSFGRRSIAPMRFAGQSGIPCVSSERFDDPRLDSIFLPSLEGLAAIRIANILGSERAWREACASSELLTRILGLDRCGLETLCAAIGSSLGSAVKHEFRHVRNSRMADQPESPLVRNTLAARGFQTHGIWAWSGVSSSAAVRPSEFLNSPISFCVRSGDRDRSRITTVVLPPRRGRVNPSYSTGLAGPEVDLSSGDDNFAASGLTQLLETASAEYLLLCRSGDILSPEAIDLVSDALNGTSSVDFAYFDAVVTDAREKAELSLCRGWSPNALLERNLINSPVVIATQIFSKLLPLKSDSHGTMEFELALKARAEQLAVLHVAVPIVQRSASDASIKSIRAEGQLVSKYLSETSARVETVKGRREVRFPVKGKPRVAIVIPTRDRVDLLKRCIKTLVRKTEYQNFDLVIVDNESVQPETHRYFASIDAKVVAAPGPFNFSRLVNLGAYATNHEYILFLNNDIEITRGDWLTRMLEWGQLPNVGAVGGKLLYPNGDLQHGGVIVGNAFGTAVEINQTLLDNYQGDYSEFHSAQTHVQDFSAVTGAAMLVRSSVFFEVGGFDELQRVAFNDIDLCLKIGLRGYDVLYVPHVELTHHESASRGRSHPVHDERRFVTRWDSAHSCGDPFLNPNYDPRPLPVVRFRAPGVEEVQS